VKSLLRKLLRLIGRRPHARGDGWCWHLCRGTLLLPDGTMAAEWYHLHRGRRGLTVPLCRRPDDVTRFYRRSLS
jgi:hypothetical protein